MTDIQILKPSAFNITPPYDPSKSIVCEHSVQVVGDHARGYRDHAFKNGVRRHARTSRPDQCTHNAVIKIKGVALCRRHAGQVVLQMYVEGEIS